MKRALLFLAIAIAGCGPDRPPPITPIDGGRFDAGRRDAGTDAGMVADAGDAGPADGGATDDAAVTGDAGMDASAPPFDAGPRPDSGPLPDGGPRPDGGPLPDAGLCSFVPPGTPCTTTASCPSGHACLDNGCGDRRCYPAGRPCGSPSDCPSGSACTAGFCGRASGCGDSRDCPAGFSCDAGSCVDRRVACGGPGQDCPHGFICDSDLTLGLGFCVRAYTRCASDAACPLGGQCRDVVGDGRDICHWAGGPACQNNADCPVIGEVCGVHPIRVDALCGRLGPCADDMDCASGYTCADLWGDGVRECVPGGGSCARTTDCTAPAVCGTMIDDTGAITPPQCITRPL